MRGGAGLARTLLLLSLGVAGCGPWGPQGILAGGPFLGVAETGAVTDWSFSDAHPTIAVETRDGWLRHSVTVLCMAHGGHLYLPSRWGGRKRWVRDLGNDPRLRVRIGERIIAGRAQRVTDPEEADAVARVLLRKYVGLDAERANWLLEPPPAGDDRADVWLFRVDAPGEEAP
jgi:hypothetical protein